MKDSPEVILFKGEVKLYKQRIKNSNTSTRLNVVRTIIGNPIKNVRNPDEDLEVRGMVNGVLSQTTYTLSTGYAANNILVSFKSQKLKKK